MTTAYTLHGEVGGRKSGAVGGARAEGFTNLINTGYTEFNSSIRRTDLAGNGGLYSIGSTTNSSAIAPNRVSQLNSTNAFRETFTRVSFYRTNSSWNGQLFIWQPTMLGGYHEGTALWQLYLFNQDLKIRTGEQTGYLIDRGTVGGFTLNMWHTLWIYVRVSTDLTTNSAVPTDGMIRIWRDDPRAAGSSQIFSFYGRIGYRNNNVPTNTTPSATIYTLGSASYIDDVVCHVPSIDFVSNSASMPAQGSVIRYTASNGDMVQGTITSNKQTGTDGSGNAVGVLTLTHMKYTPSGGSPQNFHSMGWWGGPIYNHYEGVWGTGAVTLTDTSGTTLGTGAFEYDTSRLPKDGWFMPVAKPVSATTTMTPSAGTATDSYQLIDDFGGQTNVGDYVYGDATGEYWHGEFDDDQDAGTDKLVVSGNPAVERVLTYVWGKAQGTGSVVSGEVCHYNVVTGQAASTRADSLGVGLAANWGLTIMEHPQAATSTPGTTEPWTVTNVNAASFGVYTK